MNVFRSRTDTIFEDRYNNSKNGQNAITKVSKRIYVAINRKLTKNSKTISKKTAMAYKFFSDNKNGGSVDYTKLIQYVTTKMNGSSGIPKNRYYFAFNVHGRSVR